MGWLIFVVLVVLILVGSSKRKNKYVSKTPIKVSGGGIFQPQNPVKPSIIPYATQI